jgi:calcineurin-like phosphoesterase family protein
MAQTFVISDTHFYHKNIIKYCNRPFKDELHMNEVLIENWNSVIKEYDLVIHVGDFIFGDQIKADKIIRRLKGRIHLIRGNHDKKLWNFFNNEWPNKIVALENDYYHSHKGLIWFSHYPEDVINGVTKNNTLICGVDFHIHGHIHDNVTNDPTKFNASVEQIGYKPVLLGDIISQFGNK